MWAMQDVQAGPQWVQILIAVVAVLGGGGGLAALVTVLLQRRKFKADAADVLTDTALTLVEPLKVRVAELEAEVSSARRKASAANAEMERIRDQMRDLARLMVRMREVILADPTASPELREMVRSVPIGNGRAG